MPGQNPFYPEIVAKTRGLPAYGQVFLAECLGALIYVLVCLNVKDDILKRNLDPIFYPIAACVSMVGLQLMFKEVSGGIFNPAIALSQIVWQNVTYFYLPGVDQSYWTPEYAACYIIAPLVGAFMAGNVFNYQKRLYRRIELNDFEGEISEEELDKDGNIAVNKFKKVMKIAVEK